MHGEKLDTKLEKVSFYSQTRNCPVGPKVFHSSFDDD